MNMSTESSIGIVEITDRKLIEEFEIDSTPLINIPTLRKNGFFYLYMDVISWYQSHDGFDANTSIYKKWNKISELLGFEPIYYKTYSYKNALYSFYWKKDIVLIYYDKRGMKIQVSSKFRKDEIEPFLIYLKDILTN